MRVTKLLVWLAAVGIGSLVISVRFPVLIYFTVVYDILLAAALLADFSLTPKPSKAVHAERRYADQFSLGTSNRVVVSASLRSETVRFIGRNTKLELFVKDAPPSDFALIGSPDSILQLGGIEREQTYSYALEPHRQGDYSFGKIHILLRGPIGLVERFESISSISSVKVYPNLQETEKYDILSRKGLLMQVGIRSMRMRGSGSEFESLREYVVGDEYRKIDWPATARRGKLITRQYNVEKAQNIILVLDCGRNMLQQVQKMTKLDYAINTALMLGYVAASQDDKVGLVAFDAEMRTFIPPAKGKAQVYQLLSALYNISAQMAESDYRAGFLELLARWRRRSLIVFFTDLVDPESSSEIIAAISLVEKRHRVLCVTVADPTILAAAAIDPVNEAEVYKKSVALQVLQERRSAISLLKRRNVWTIDSPPEALSADLINHYLELKARSAI
jgi:uncharacterized protein (DUF58 family)